MGIFDRWATSRPAYFEKQSIRCLAIDSAFINVSCSGSGADADVLEMARKIPGILDSIATRILVVEDHGDTRRVLMSMLSRWGYEVSAADSVASGLEFVRAKDFDVVLSDIGLPDGDGYDLVSAAKQIQKFKAVALSAYGSAEDISRGRAAGFDHHLTKPVDFQELRSVIASPAA